MSKEEIIIDGVNVKDCKRRIGKNSYCRYFKRHCADNNFNCIWKQHERLKEENVKFKKALSDIKEIVKEISYLSSRGERELRFKIKNILEEVVDEEIY